MQVHPEVQKLVLKSLRNMKKEVEPEDNFRSLQRLITAFENTPTIKDLKEAWELCSGY